jgi:PAS domain S-box-containing protein
MRFFTSVEGLLRQELSVRARWALLGVTIALTLATAYLNAQFPLLRLSFLAVVYVIAIDALLGLGWGLVGAVAIACIFSGSEWASNAMGQRVFALPNFFSRLILFFLLLGLVELIRHQTRALNEGQRQSHELEVLRLKNQLAESDARFQVASESIPFGVWRCNLEGRVTYMSPSFLNLLGMTLEDIRDGGWFARVVDEDASRIREAWRNRESWSDVWEDEYRILGADGKLHTVLCRGSAVRNDAGETIGWTGVNFDLTERQKAREQLRFLADAGRILSLSLDPRTTLERIAHLVVPRYADWCSIDIVAEDGSLQTMILQHTDPQKLDLVRELRGFPRDDPARGPANVVRTGVSELHDVITEETLREALSGAGERYVELVCQLGLRSAMTVPLRARDKILGVMTFAQSESNRYFSTDDVHFAEILSARAALAYDNARMYAKEQRVADTFQRASLPTSLPRLPGIKLRAMYLPGATESEIGGDWYDAFLLPSGDIAISIGDVAGKGLNAAVAMVTARQAIRGAALEGSTPSEVLARVNQRLTYEGGGMVTALFGILDPVTLGLTFACAGHPSPLLGHPSGKVEVLPSKGTPLGLFFEPSYEEVKVTLLAGDLVVLYTDGLIEFSRNVSEGERLLVRAVAAEAEAQTPDPSEAIVRRVILGAPKDDVAVLTISVAAAPLDTLDLVVTSEPASARVIRQSLRRFAAGVGLDEGRTTDFLVACGEAISNVIEHAYGIGEGPLVVQGSQEGDELVIKVSDRGKWRPPREDGSGRGLLIMRALADKFEVVRSEEGTTVNLRMSVSGAVRDRPSNLSATGH